MAASHNVAVDLERRMLKLRRAVRMISDSFAFDHAIVDDEPPTLILVETGPEAPALIQRACDAQCLVVNVARRMATDSGVQPNARWPLAIALGEDLALRIRSGSLSETEAPTGSLSGSADSDTTVIVGRGSRLFADDLIGESPALIRVMKMAERIAASDASVLLLGETGTGKEVFSRAIHRSSQRRGAFIAVNCAAIPAALIESELFGHVRGAFTGASAQRPGQFAAAHRGTLLLDEIGDLPLAMQAKLLRVLQEHEVTPVGSERSVPVDVRVIAAGHADLHAMVRAGTFRADLLYRLDVARIRIPALRERREDIPLLANHFLADVRRRYPIDIEGFSPAANRWMQSYAWPGNVRELQSVVERAAVRRWTGPIDVSDLHLHSQLPPQDFVEAERALLRNVVIPAQAQVPNLSTPSNGAIPAGGAPRESLPATLERLERSIIAQALERTGGNRVRTAALLQIKRTTLIEKLHRFGMS
ncbi:MAG: sigma 54-interacting transcriptional regulator [Deltaproteobacteria bacterium]|nr:sigma 54-interacting transcriptional regulator [Deltaproteobacteria bacterium]